MAYPDLYHDESRILEAQNIKVKSVSFNAVLTNRRLFLLDSKKGTMPAQEILLATLKNIDSGENAIRDPTITLSIITNTGTTRQMILTFPKMSGGDRKREADEWVKALRKNLSHPFEHPVLPEIPAPAYDEYIPAVESQPVAVPQPPRIEIVNAPPQKKRIEISRPMKRIIESEPAMPKPVETTSLPVGSFCNRCGSRVPPESAFCNRCGTPVVKESDLSAAYEPPTSPQPVVYQAAQPVPTEFFQEPVPEPAPVVVPQVAVPLPPVFGQSSDRKERPIEQVIHSIEPLIEDSVPRTEPAPLIPRTTPLPAPEPEVPEPPAATVTPTPSTTPATDSNVQWPVIAPAAAPDPVSPAGTPEPGTPQPVAGAPSGRGKIIAFAVIAIVIVAAIAGVFLFANPLQTTNSPTPTPVPTQVPVSTTAVVTMPVTTTVAVVATASPAGTPSATAAPASLVPTSGVWVHVNYKNQFNGQIGTPNALREVSDTGEKYYQISTSTGTVAASVSKVDGSADPLTVEIYKDGELVTKKSTVAPKGMVELQVSLKPAPTPTPVFTLEPTTSVTTQVANSTANATAAQ